MGKASAGYVLRSPSAAAGPVPGPLTRYGFGPARGFRPAVMGSRRQLAAAGFLPADPGPGLTSGGAGVFELGAGVASTCYYAFEPDHYFGRPGFLPRVPRFVVISYPLLASQGYGGGDYDPLVALGFASRLAAAYPTLAARGIHVYLSSTGMTLGLPDFPTQPSPFLSSPYLGGCIVTGSAAAAADLGSGFVWHANLAVTIPAQVVGGDVLYVQFNSFGDYVINAPTSVISVPGGVSTITTVGASTYCSWDAKIQADSAEAAAAAGNYRKLGNLFLYLAPPGDVTTAAIYGAVAGKTAAGANVSLLRSTLYPVDTTVAAAADLTASDAAAAVLAAILNFFP